MNRLDTFFGSDPSPTMDLVVGTGDKTVKKDWSDDFLRIINLNKYYEGKELTTPYSQSYIVYRAIRAIAENVPQAVYRINKDGEEVPILHPLQQLFNKPNPYMSRFEFWEAIATYLNLKGESFIYVVKNNSGVPVQLWVFDPDLVKHTIGKDGLLTDWVFNNTMPIPPEDMVHFKLFNPNKNSIRGLSPIEASRQEMEADYSAARYNKIFFDNNATPNGVVEVDKEKTVELSELRKLKDMWNETHKGSENSHKTAFLLGGMTYKSMGIAQRDMEFITGRRFSREAVLGTFGVPAFVAGFDQDNPNRATALASKRIFWMNTIKPQLMRIQEKLNANFFATFFPEYKGWFDYTTIEELQEEYTIKLDNATKLFAIGYTRNEANLRLDLGMPVDPDGDTRYLPMNLIEQGDSEDAEPVKMVEATKIEVNTIIKDYVSYIEVKNGQLRNFTKFQKQMEKIFQGKLSKYFFNLRKEVMKLLKVEKEFDPEMSDLLSEINNLFDDSGDNLVAIVTPLYIQSAEAGAELAYSTLGVEKEFIINETILNSRLNLIRGMNENVYNSLRKELFEGIKEGEGIEKLAERTRSVFNTTTKRSKVIARTETGGMMNGTSLDVYKTEGVGQKQWLASPGARDSHAAINGEIVTVATPFSNGLMYPGDPNGSAAETVNCRCSISPVIQ